MRFPFDAAKSLPSTGSISEDLETQLKAVSCYHGHLPREDLGQLLHTDGQYLLRLAEPTPGQGLKPVVSVRWAAKHHHLLIERRPDCVVLECGRRRARGRSVADLLRRGGAALAEAGGPRLLEPVPRQDWELRRAQLELGARLGSGQFGDVYSGLLRVPEAGRDAERVRVAVKVDRRADSDREVVKSLCKEARIMRRYDHKNIVKFYGITVDAQPLMLVMELVDGGALDHHLRRAACGLSKRERLRMCADAARGLDYLHRKGCIHRDVAARNCLVTAAGRVKLGDFGLSRQMPVRGATYMAKAGQLLPTRWLAPETILSNSSSTKSDVFSFGVLMWEVYSDAQTPYNELPLAEVGARICMGYRLAPAADMSQAVAEVMYKCCFAAHPKQRKDMGTILQLLESELDMLEC